MSNILIGTGFHCTENDAHLARNQFRLWDENTGDLEYIVADNSAGNLIPPVLGLRSIKINHNLGHVGQWLNDRKNAPKILGWSMSWIQTALVAYSERKSFLYKESDCFCFGNWLDVILKDAAARNLKASFGTCPPQIAACEQSLFYIRCDYIPQFISDYLAIPHGDAEMLPEDKFVELMMRPDSMIAQFDLPVGRGRPIPWDAPAFYAQKLTLDEIKEARRRGLFEEPSVVTENEYVPKSN